MTRKKNNQRHRHTSLTRTFLVTGRCSVQIPLTFVPLAITCRFADQVNDRPHPCCIPWVPDQLTCEISYLDTPITFGPGGRHHSYWGLTLAWHINGPAQTRSIEWTVEGDLIELD